MPERGIAESYGRSIFSVCNNFNADFHSRYKDLHSHQQCFFVLHSHHQLFVFLMIPILTGVRWNFSVVLICIFCMVKDVEFCERLFLYLLRRSSDFFPWFCLNVLYYIYLGMLNHPCIPRMKLIWSYNMIFLFVLEFW
jgi:hypothetical protein